MTDTTRVIRLCKRYADQLVARAQGQIDRGDVHENQGCEFERAIRDHVERYKGELMYAERCEIIEYFWDRIYHLDYGRKGINAPNKRQYPSA